jgi:hypothetical protein
VLYIAYYTSTATSAAPSTVEGAFTFISALEVTTAHVFYFRAVVTSSAEMEVGASPTKLLGPITAKNPTYNTPKQGVELSFAAFGFRSRRPEQKQQKGWTGLELKPQKLPSDFKTKKRKPAIWPSEVARGRSK